MRELVKVSGKKALAAFVDFPHDLYAGDVNYVPELFIAQRDLLSPGKHPFYEHSEIQLFLLYDEGKIVGRIAAINNTNHNKVYESNDGFFGFFDCINDATVAKQLFEAAEDWLKQKGLTKVLGPVNFSTNEVCGLLIEGFEGPPVAMMPYNARYYLPLLEQIGFQKNVDLRAYRYTAGSYNDRSVKLMDTQQPKVMGTGRVLHKALRILQMVFLLAWAVAR